MAANNIFEGMIEALEKAVNAGLKPIGQKLANDMKNKLRENESDVGHRLSGSITWATADAVDRSLVGSAAEEGDVIQKPSEKYTLIAGTQAPYAIYLEKGTGRHQTSDEVDEYEDRIREWAASKGITDPDHVEAIITNIRRKGTLKHPFVQPVRDEWASSGMASKMLSKTVNDAMSKVVKNWKPQVIPMEVKI
jgi:hypothetical protein